MSELKITSTIKREIDRHPAFHNLLLRKMRDSIDDFLTERTTEIGKYSLEKLGDEVTITIGNTYEDVFLLIGADLQEYLIKAFDIKELTYSVKKIKAK